MTNAKMIHNMFSMFVADRFKTCQAHVTKSRIRFDVKVSIEFFQFSRNENPIHHGIP